MRLTLRLLKIRVPFRIFAIHSVLLGAVCAQQPADFDSLVASAQSAQASQDFNTAAGFYRQASAIHPESAELKANLGLMYYQLGKNEQAAHVFLEALRLKPGLFVPEFFLGLDYVRLRRFDEAIPYLKRAAQLRPDDAQVLIGLGEAYAGAHQTRMAIHAYIRTTEIDPGDADAWYRLGVAYLEQVENDARTLLTRHRDTGYTQALVAENFAEQGAFNEATVSYQKALSFTSYPPGTHAGFGFALINHRDYDAAEKEFRAELAANPGSLLAKLGIARLDVERGSSEQAAKMVDEIWNSDAGFLAVNVERFNTGLTEEMRSDFRGELNKLQASAVLSLFESAAEEDIATTHLPSGGGSEPVVRAGQTDAPQLYTHGSYRQCSDLLFSRQSALSAKELSLLAQCAYATGDYQRTYDTVEKLAAHTTTASEALYWETKSSEKLAAAALSRASRADSTSPKLHVLLGDIARQQQRMPDAEREYRKALALRPRDPGALFGLSLALLADSRRDEAFQVAQAAVNDNPDDPELNAVMGEILCDRGDFSTAESYLKRSLNTKPEYVSRVHELLGKVYANTNRAQEAIAELKMALPADKDGSLHYQLGRLYVKIGDRASAQRAFEISKQLESDVLKRPLKDLVAADTESDHH